MPLPNHLEVAGVPELTARMAAGESPLEAYSAEVRVTYFGPEGRVRTTGSIAVARPASLRYEVQGPHGGVVSAFATNGLELEALDLGSSRFVYGPATPAHLDALLPFAPLGLSARGWVKLLFGEVDVPADATLSYDDRVGHFVLTWRQGPSDRRVEVNPATSRVVRAEAREGGVVVSEVLIEEREAHGIPVSLHLRVPQVKAELEVKLRDVEPDPELPPDVFVLTPPSGVALEHLGSP
jgi:hypothetical protein